MADDQARFRRTPGAQERLEEAIAYGLLNAAGAVETASKVYVPVHGDPTQGADFATFAPGEKPIGGTLRRSVHSAAYVHGRRIGTVTTDENREQLPDYVAGAGPQAFVGTNSGYGFWVHQGTSKMPGRPFLSRGLAEIRPRIAELIAAGVKRRLGQ